MFSASVIGFVILSGVGFGAKTGCTNNASVDGLSKASCDAIDAWAWGGLITMLAVILVGYAALVPRWLHEAVLIATIALVVVAATLGMASVQPT